jgi:hypothetical protein
MSCFSCQLKKETVNKEEKFMSRIGLENGIGQDKAFAGSNGYKGICVTCNDAPFCARLAHHGQAVWYCEEFNDYTPPLNRTGRPNSDFTKAEKYDVALGICGNCQNRKSCALASAGTSIWHCEEYS